MINKELKRLSRRELVDIIYQMKKNEQQMQEEISALRAALEDKRIRLSEAGSVAEAAANITQVLSAAQETADLYLREIACMKDQAQEECDKKIREASRKAAGILSGAEEIPEGYGDEPENASAVRIEKWQEEPRKKSKFPLYRKSSGNANGFAERLIFVSHFGVLFPCWWLLPPLRC